MAIFVVRPATLVNEIVCVEFAATNENQTSSFTPVAAQVGAGAADAVADTVVPFAVAVQIDDEFTVNAIAAQASSFIG